MPNRRDFYRLGAIALGNLFALAVAVPGVKYLLDPLGKSSGNGEFRTLTRLGQLKVGEPRAFSILAERQDAWVKYPREPVGSVWLVRQPEGSKVPVVALSARVPAPELPGPPRPRPEIVPLPVSPGEFRRSKARSSTRSPLGGWTRLPVELSGDADPEVRVKFERFQPQSAEKKPLA